MQLHIELQIERLACVKNRIAFDTQNENPAQCLSVWQVSGYRKHGRGYFLMDVHTF